MCSNDLFQGNQLVPERSQLLLEDLCFLFEGAQLGLHGTDLVLQGGYLLVQGGGDRCAVWKSELLQRRDLCLDQNFCRQFNYEDSRT